MSATLPVSVRFVRSYRPTAPAFAYDMASMRMFKPVDWRYIFRGGGE